MSVGEWDVSLPIDHTKIGNLPGEERKITAKVKTVLEKEHETMSDGNSGAQHRLGSGVANEGTTTPTKTVDITSGSVALDDIARDRGRLWLDDNFDPPVLKRWKGEAWEVVGTIAAGASPNIAKLISTTAEDSDGGRESSIDFKGTQSGNEVTTLGRVQFSHEGSSDDEKGQVGILLNDGDDTNTPSKEAIRFKSTGKIKVADSLCVLDEDDLASDDAEVLATQQSIKAHADSGRPMQIVYTQSASNLTIGNIPYDDTIPQSSEGTEILTRTVTPKSASSTLKIEATVMLGTSDNDTMIMALFKDAGTDAIAVADSGGFSASSRTQTLHLVFYVSAGSTSEQTFKIRAGRKDSLGGGTNGITSGTRKYGGVANMNLTVTEIGA